MSLIIFDPETGTVLGAEGALLVDTDELEAHAKQIDPSYQDVASALTDEDPSAQQIASAIGKPIVD